MKMDPQISMIFLFYPLSFFMEPVYYLILFLEGLGAGAWGLEVGYGMPLFLCFRMFYFLIYAIQ